MKKILTLKNQISEVSLLEPYVDELCDDYGLNPALGFNLNLVLEEVVTNVINYGYPADEEHTFTVSAEMTAADELTCIVRDDGVAFNPLEEAPEVDTTLGVEERKIGGLGIFLVKQIMDNVSYQHLDGYNILTMKKKTI